MRVSTKILGLMITVSFVAAAAPAEQQKDRHLGPTGLFGTIAKQQIQVTKVANGSPADGKLKTGNVILGAGEAMFESDVRRELADAIDQAETEKGKGLLALTVKADGKATRRVVLQLKVLGTYSATAPFNCHKTDAIISQTADYLVRTKEIGGRLQIGLLGLLATGEQKYIDVVKDVIHQAPWAKPDIKLSLQDTSTTWSWGYANLVLCEYYLLTHDEYVLPAIKAYAVTAAMGRDAVGLWGHRMADPNANNGKLHGRLYVYAQINQPSLSMFVSLILAEECGIKDPELRAGIEQTHAFYASFIGKGALNYGVHGPNTKLYCNNGTSGSAALAMALLGDTRGAAFFSRLSTAAHSSLETGHTGHYFNQLWTGLGANLAGPEAASAFFRETRWLHTLNRTWDGSFTYDDAGGGRFSYSGLSDPGSHLLNYCLGRHKLYITGSHADPSIWLKGKEVGDTIALCTIDYKTKSDAELLAMFGHPMPQLRGAAVWALRSRTHNLGDSIKKMVKTGTREQRLSAIGYFAFGCPAAQALPELDDLGTVVRDQKAAPELRGAAANALSYLGEPAYMYYADMLKLVVADEPEDAFGALDESLGESLTTLCKNPYAAGLVKDKELFYKAVIRLLDHKRQNGRCSGMRLIANIPLEDFHCVADKVLYVLEDKDLTYHSYHNQGPRGEAAAMLANLHVRDGVDFALDCLNSPTGKYGFKIRMIDTVLAKYAGNAKHALPRLKELLPKNPGLANAIKVIESSPETEKMIGFEEARQAGLKNAK